MLRSATVKVYSLHQGEISRLRREFANSTSGEQAPRPPSCECEVDSMSKLIEPHLIKLHNCDAHCCSNSICTVCIMQRYIAHGDDSLTLRLVSKLPDLRVANAKWIQ